jgi:dihydropteroate synthase
MFKIPAKDLVWDITTPQVMGIINCTSDSFYAPSRQQNIEELLLKVGQFQKEGAAIIDIGAQSTRPNAQLLSADLEIEQLIPVIHSIRKVFPRLLISIDTFHAKVAQESLEAGANIINDISCGSFDSAILEVVSKYKAGYIGMHLTGSMHAMHTIEPRENVMNSLLTYFEEKRKLLLSAGIQQWVIDPGFGFGKTIEENFRLIRELSQLNSIGLPVLLGASRKSSIYKTLSITAEEALNGTSMVNTVALLYGANIIRVHDVKEAVELVKLLPFLK